MTLKIKVNDPIFNTSQEYSRIHVWCKFVDPSPNLCRYHANQISYTVEPLYKGHLKWWPFKRGGLSNKQYLIISWYLHVQNGVAVAAYSRLTSRSQAKFHTKKLSPLVRPCAAAPAHSTTSAHRSLNFRRATSSPRGWWVGSWPLLLRSVHEDTS